MKRGMKLKKKSGIIGLCLCVVLAGCSFSGSSRESEGTTIQQTKIIDVPVTETEVRTEQNTESRVVVSPDALQKVTIASHSVVKDKTGSDALVIEYEWTNNSDKETSFMVACSDTVYQHGIECPSYGVLVDEVDSQQETTDIKPGTTYHLKIAYQLQDNSNALVEVTDLLGREYYLAETIGLGGGEGNPGGNAGNAATTVKISEMFLSKDYKDRAVLVIKYEFTNGSDRPLAFSSTFVDKVYQNGVECSSMAVFCDDVDSSTTVASIKPGVTIIVEEGYLLNDTSEVDIEVKELFGNKVYLSERRPIR